MSAHLQPLEQLPHAMEARGWDLHVERVGSFAREPASAEPRAPRWVAQVHRAPFVLEGTGRTPAAAIEDLWNEVVRYARDPEAHPAHRAAAG